MKTASTNEHTIYEPELAMNDNSKILLVKCTEKRMENENENQL